MIADRKQMADIFGVTTRTIDTWQKEGLPVVAVPGRPCSFDTVRAIEWRLARVGASADGEIDQAHEKARLTRAQADRAELEAAELKGTLIQAEQVAQTWGNVLANVKTRIRSIPTKLAHKLANVRKISEAEELLRDSLDQALEELSAYEPPQIRDEESPLDAEAPAEPDGEPVGRRKPAAKPRVKR